MAIKLKVNTGTDSVRVIAAGEKKPVIVPDSVALGADTTGNYIATIDAGAGIVVTPNTHIEQANVVISHAATTTAANTTNDAFAFVRNVDIDQFGHVIGFANTELNSDNFSVANGVISSQPITLANTTFNLGDTVTSLDNLIFSNTLEITGPNNDVSFGDNRITNVARPEANTDVVTREYLSDELVALELTVRVVEDPVEPQDAANKRYVDATAQGLVVRPTAKAATTGDLGGTWASGNTSYGATITLPPALLLNIDGVTDWIKGDNIVVKDQTNPEENGSYNVEVVGDAVTSWVLQRAFFNLKASDVPGSFEFVTDGNVYGKTGWVMTVDDAVNFDLDQDDIQWVQFSGEGTYQAGVGITLDGTEFNVDDTQIFNSITANSNLLTITSDRVLINGLGALTIPDGATSDRPTAERGMIRFNTTDGQFEGYDGTAWAGLGGVIDVDQDTKIEAENSPGSDNDQLKFVTGGTQTLLLDSTQMLANVDIVIDTSGALTIPNGATADRPTAAQGMIRFNTTDGQFEGYDGAAWSGLGGVIDVDQDTKILADNGSDNDQLRFFTANSERLQIQDDGNLKFGDGLNKFTVDYATGNTNIAGTLNVTGVVTIAGNLTLGDDETDSITVVADFESHLIPDADRTYNLGATNKNWQKLFVDTIGSDDEVITIDTTGAIKIPVGSDAQRPAAVTGMLRYNTDDSRFEGYDGAAWSGIAGSVIDIDQDTKIIAENSAGADNDQLRFFNANNETLRLESNGNFSYGSGLDKFTIDYNTGAVNVNGKLDVDDIEINGSVISSTNGNLELRAESNTDVIDVGYSRISSVAVPTANNDVATKQYVDDEFVNFSSNVSLISGENGANTYNYIDLLKSPEITFSNGIEVKGVPEQSNNAFEIGLNEPMAGSTGIYGNDGFTPRIRITSDGRIDFATEIPVELQANAIPDFTETSRDIISLMFTDSPQDKGITVINNDANNYITLQARVFDLSLDGDITGTATVDRLSDTIISTSIATNYVEQVTSSGDGISVSTNSGIGINKIISLDYTHLNTIYPRLNTSNEFAGAITAPRFIDSDDNTKFIDPAGTSEIHRLRVGVGGTSGQIQMRDGSGYAYLYSGGGKIGFLNTGFNFAAYANPSTGDWVVENGDIKGERFVDVDDTDYLIHPGGTDSKIKQLEVEDSIIINNLKAGDGLNHSTLYTVDGGDITIKGRNIILDPSSNNSINASSATIINVATPVNGTDAANKRYVDDVAQGLRVIPAALAGTTESLNATYNNAEGTLTSNVNEAFAVDSVTTWSVGDRVLVKDQTNSEENGSYEVTTVGSGSVAWVLTRGEYFNESNEIPGSFQFITDGTINSGSGWVATVSDAETFILGTDDVTFYQFSGAGTYIAGEGLGLTGTTFNVNVDDSTLEINNDTVRVKDAGVTNAKLANPNFTISGESGANTNIALGGTLIFEAGEGVNTTINSGKVTIAGEVATDINLGVAAFSNTNFEVVAGSVSITEIDGGTF